MFVVILLVLYPVLKSNIAVQITGRQQQLVGSGYESFVICIKGQGTSLL